MERGVAKFHMEQRQEEWTASSTTAFGGGCGIVLWLEVMDESLPKVGSPSDSSEEENRASGSHAGRVKEEKTHKKGQKQASWMKRCQSWRAWRRHTRSWMLP